MNHSPRESANLAGEIELSSKSPRSLVELLEATCEGVCLINRSGTVVACDEQFRDKAGTVDEPLDGKPLDQLCENGDQIRQIANQAWENGRGKGSVELHLGEGARLPMFIHGQRIERNEQEDVVVLLFKDLLEREMSQITYRRERLLRGAFFDAVAEGLYRLQLDNPLATFWPEELQIDHLTREARIKSCNEAAARHLGVGSSQEAEGQRVEQFLGATTRRVVEKFVRSDYQLQGERVVIDTRNNRRHFQVNLIGLDQGNDKLEEVWGSALDITEQIQRESRFARRLEQRKQAVARKLHDEVSPYLTGARLMIDQFAGQEDDEDLDLLAEYLEKARDYVAHVHSDLRPPAEGESLRRVLEELVSQHNKFGETNCEFEANTEAEELDKEATTHLFRIAQEALRNALRHSGAENVNVSLRKNKDHLELDVHDDGQGFDPDSISSTSGLENMRYRAEALGADLKTESDPQQGTTIRCVLPID